MLVRKLEEKSENLAKAAPGTLSCREDLSIYEYYCDGLIMSRVGAEQSDAVRWRLVVLEFGLRWFLGF